MRYASRPGSLYDIATVQLNRVLIASKLTIISEGFPRVLEIVLRFSCYAIMEHNRTYPITDNYFNFPNARNLADRSLRQMIP